MCVCLCVIECTPANTLTESKGPANVGRSLGRGPSRAHTAASNRWGSSNVDAVQPVEEVLEPRVKTPARRLAGGPKGDRWRTSGRSPPKPKDPADTHCSMIRGPPRVSTGHDGPRRDLMGPSWVSTGACAFTLKRPLQLRGRVPAERFGKGPKGNFSALFIRHNA